MTRIAEVLAEASGPTLSVEFFPPKTEAGDQLLERTLDDLDPIELSFVSVTYGAGGSTRERTRDLVVDIAKRHHRPTMAHLTCIGHTEAELVELLDDYGRSGVHNILALAGDPPADGSDPRGDFSYAIELVELVKAHPAGFSVGVAAHPELHPRSTDRGDDRRHLAEKLALADLGLTQFFFDAEHYFRMVDELAALGCSTPVVPGVMPVTNPAGVRRMAQMAGASVPEDLLAKIEAADEGDRRAIAVDAAVQMSRRLLEGEAPGLHLYALNRSETVLDIIEGIGLS